MAVIYKATNTINGKAYVGFAVNLEKRMIDHRNKAMRENGEYFHRAIRKYGFETFEWKTLKEDATLEDEISFIESESTFWKTGKGYNLTKGGEGKLGYITSESTKMKQSIAGKKRVLTEKQLTVLRENAALMRERGHTEETKKRISEAHKGKVFTKKHKENISKNHAARKETGAYYKSEEYKRKMSKSISGRKHSEETKRKMAESRRKYWIEKKAT